MEFRIKSLEWYRNKDRPSKEKFYDGGVGSGLLFKARTGSLETNRRTWRWNGGGRSCNQCVVGENPVDESVEHILIECDRYEEERRELDTFMGNKIGVTRWEEEKQSENRGIDYVLGFRELKNMRGTKKFLEGAWRKRNARAVRGEPGGGGIGIRGNPQGREEGQLQGHIGAAVGLHDWEGVARVGVDLEHQEGEDEVGGWEG